MLAQYTDLLSDNDRRRLQEEMLKAETMKNGCKTLNLHIIRESKMPAITASKPSTNQTTSIVDYLNSKKLATQHDIKNCSGMAAENTAHLNQLRSESVVSKPSTVGVKTGSVVDWLKANTMDSSFSARAKLVKQYGIKNYRGITS